MTIFDTTDRWLCHTWATYQAPPRADRTRLSHRQGEGLIGDGASPTTSRLSRRQAESGSVTMENVIWALAVIVIAGIVVAAITGYVQSNAAKLGG